VRLAANSFHLVIGHTGDRILLAKYALRSACPGSGLKRRRKTLSLLKLQVFHRLDHQRNLARDVLSMLTGSF
jgi:hypothetical protein